MSLKEAMATRSVGGSDMATRSVVFFTFPSSSLSVFGFVLELSLTLSLFGCVFRKRFEGKIEA